MAAPMEVTQKTFLMEVLLVRVLFLESFSCHYPVQILKLCLKIHVHVIRHIRCQVNIEHESAVLIGLFHATSSVLPSAHMLENIFLSFIAQSHSSVTILKHFV